ncbi:hypothetical protein MKX07_003414 [Trichoderma sp. CBMAI-0711]|nr:hypothetical protein MKX07_003414 [Trichoderma sp. CBMAI-0711]
MRSLSTGMTIRANIVQVSLPSSVAVWAASDEAAFLHGRFIWSAWDVEELQMGPLRERIETDDKFLRIGVYGL